MSTLDFAAFQARALGDGYDEVLERSWPADAALDAHTHPFALRLRLVAGEMWLTVGSEVRQLRPGDECELAREVLHAERYGHQGATYWVARRN